MNRVVGMWGFLSVSLSQFQKLNHHGYVLIKPTISVFPWAYWLVSFFSHFKEQWPVIILLLYLFACSLHLSCSLSSPWILPSLWASVLWTKINSSASRLHKRLAFSHLDSSLAFYELLNSTLCYAVWVGAPKLIIPQPWCLLHRVCYVTKKCIWLFLCSNMCCEICFCWMVRK